MPDEELAEFERLIDVIDRDLLGLGHGRGRNAEEATTRRSSGA